MGRAASLPDVAVCDFETEAIGDRPKSYPPKPVGVALQLPGERPQYWAWGHPTGNNCTQGQGLARLRGVWKTGLPILCHNGKFDLDVAATHLGLPMPAWDRTHDTLFLLALMDPHASSLRLKDSAHRLLGIAPKERDALKEWILANVDAARRKPSTWGAYICLAPGDLVGKYAAQGDAASTYKLFKHLHPAALERGMGPAYDRERRLMPYLLDNERAGLRVDVARLRRDIPKYEACLAKADAWLKEKLKNKNLNLDSNEDLAAALIKSRVARRQDFLYTDPTPRHPQGQMSVSKESLEVAVRNPQVRQILLYRTKLTTCLRMFMGPWLEEAQETGGRIHTTWRQVRGGGGDYSDRNNTGARTGRLICSNPNLLNLAKDFEGRDDGYTHPTWMRSLLPLPLVRLYILPEKGELFGHRDYNQQELRLLAHFEDGALCAAYNADPKLDVHNFARDAIHRATGLYIKDRTRVKNLNFGDIYGLGVPGLVRKLNCTVEEARTLKEAKKKAMPDVEDLKKAIKILARSGEPIVTIGGRQFYPEEPKIIHGKMQEFLYKLLNYLIQGSAADMTKQAVINYHEHPQRKGRFLVTVYDELNASLPKGKAGLQELTVMDEAMQSFSLDVPLISDAKIGPSWGEIRKLT